MTISGRSFAGLDPDLRAEIEARDLQLDLEMLPGGSWSVWIHHPGAHRSVKNVPPGPIPAPVVRPSEEILLIDDDPTLSSIVARFLSAHGYQVRQASSEKEAEEILRESRPGLILLDINLTDETGWDLLDSAAYRGAGAPPVVIVSATTIRTARLREQGISGYLPKPFAMETLLAVVGDRLHPSGEVVVPF